MNNNAYFAPADMDSIRKSINNVLDPDLLRPLGELNAIHDIQTHEKTIKVFLMLQQPLHFVAAQLDIAVKEAVLSVVPSAEVEIYAQEFPTQQNTQNLTGVKNLIAVASGKGGVGKSTVAANLAVALALQGASVGLIDADIHGPSIPTMFGLQGEQLSAEKGADGQMIGHPIEKFGVHVASMGFVLGRDQAAIMRGPMQAGYFSTLVDQMKWGDLDYLLFDLPPGTGDIHLTLAQKIPLTGAVIVTTPQDISLVDVRRGISMFDKVNVDVLGVIENMSYHICSKCGNREDVFSHGGGKNIAEELQVPFLGELPLNIKVREGGDEGVPVVLNELAPHEAHAIMNIAANLAAEVRIHNAKASAMPVIQISL